MIGIIGFGRFGKLATKYFLKDFDVYVYEPSDSVSEIEATGAKNVSLKRACAQPYIILCVPISVLETVIERIAPLVKEGSVVLDVSSVKTYPAQWMKEGLPEHVEILATHPMFGPDSAVNSLDGRKILLAKVRIAEMRYAKIKEYLISKGLEVIESTPEEHDRQIAVSLSLTHFIGRALAKFGAKPLEIDTEGYKRLLHILGVVEHDTWQLFQDMHRYNPYAQENREAFIKALQEIHKELK